VGGRGERGGSKTTVFSEENLTGAYFVKGNRAERRAGASELDSRKRLVNVLQFLVNVRCDSFIPHTSPLTRPLIRLPNLYIPSHQLLPVQTLCLFTPLLADHSNEREPPTTARVVTDDTGE